MRGVTYSGVSDRMEISPMAANLMFIDMAPAAKIIKERCGDDTLLVIGNSLSTLEPIRWGRGLGKLKVELFPVPSDVSEKGLLAFEALFQAADDLDFHRLAPVVLTSVPMASDWLDHVVALSAVHEAVKSALVNNTLDITLEVLASLDSSAILKLKS